ncbi:MAG: hypothetical protein L0Y35_03190 [Flammeovirgaceae bacterium]|nr:hypothetical protein [Flammeovirgaceae bacterium]
MKKSPWRSSDLKKKRPGKPEVHKIMRSEKETEKPFDFGGLPNRDLKKNLGCG